MEPINFENPQQQEHTLCRKELGDCKKEITRLEGTIAELTSNKNYSGNRKNILQLELNRLMTKINDDYSNRWQHSVEEGNLRRDIEQARCEENTIIAQMYPFQQQLAIQKRRHKLLLKKDKRIANELQSGLKLSDDEEEGMDNPMTKYWDWTMNMLGDNAPLKMIGMIIIIIMLAFSIFSS